jgi:hypothetical protein
MTVRRCQGESGVSLILALGFLALFSVFIPQLLELGATDLLVTSRLQEQRAAIYAADGTTDGAIQYLRSHTNCGRVINPSCPISQFEATVNGVTAITTFTFSGRAIDYDRTLDLTTSVDGVPRVTAHVIIRDSAPSGGDVPVDVQSWTYIR